MKKLIPVVLIILMAAYGPGRRVETSDTATPAAPAADTAVTALVGTAQALYEGCRQPLQPTFDAVSQGFAAGEPTAVAVFNVVDRALAACYYVYQTAMAPTMTPTP